MARQTSYFYGRDIPSLVPRITYAVVEMGDNSFRIGVAICHVGLDSPRKKLGRQIAEQRAVKDAAVKIPSFLSERINKDVLGIINKYKHAAHERHAGVSIQTIALNGDRGYNVVCEEYGERNG